LVKSSLTVRASGDVFVDSIRATNTRRAYAIAVDKTTDCLGHTRSLADVVDDEIGETLERLWHSGSQYMECAPRRGAVMAGLVPRTRAHRPDGPGLGETLHSTRLHDTRALAHGDRPAHRPP
jgi:hypothetical protein